jgi:hypothetical protein
LLHHFCKDSFVISFVGSQCVSGGLSKSVCCFFRSFGIGSSLGFSCLLRSFGIGSSLGFSGSPGYNSRL